MMLFVLLIPLVSALLLGFLRPAQQPMLSVLSGLALLAASIALLWQVNTTGNLSLALGAWPLPQAIEFYVDGLSALLIVGVALIAFIVSLYQLGWQEPDRETTSANTAQSLQQGLIASTVALLMAADLFNLYVWFELMLITLLGLLVSGGRMRHLESALKYYALSMLGTLLMLAAIGLVYASTGQLNFSALSEIANDPSMHQALPLASGLLLMALLLKVGAFPVYAWLPGSYHTLPIPLLALAGGLLTKITLYVILRLNSQVFDWAYLHEALGWLALATMISGALGAAFHWDLRRILAFHIVSQIGYLLLGVALSSAASATATSFFLLHNLLVKANLILIAGLMWMRMGHADLRHGGGVLKADPWLAVMFLFSAIALVGIPPSSGFWGKWMLLEESFNQQRYVWGGVALATGLLTLYSMLKIWIEGFWKPLAADDLGHSKQPVGGHAHLAAAESGKLSRQPAALIAVSILTLVIVALGLAPDPVIELLHKQPLSLPGG